MDVTTPTSRNAVLAALFSLLVACDPPTATTGARVHANRDTDSASEDDGDESSAPKSKRADAGTASSKGTSSSSGGSSSAPEDEGETAPDRVADPSDFDWKAVLQLSSVPAVGWSGGDFGSPHFLDVMGHTQPGSRFLSDSPTTNAHESMHGLEADMRNAKGSGWGFFYVDGGKGAYVSDAELDAAKIKDHVSPRARELASGRYQLYLVQQISMWPNVLYQFDEWCAYKTNARIAVEMSDAGKWTESATDEVDGAMDFLVFASAAVRALELEEPAKLEDPQFKAAYAMLAEESMKYITRGLKKPEFAAFHAGDLLDELRTGAGSAELRSTLVKWMGPTWTKRVIGF